MKFLCVINHLDQEIEDKYTLLKQACDQRNIQFVEVEANHYDFVRQLPGLKRPYLLYRVSQGMKARIVEQELLRPQAATFYQSPFLGIANLGYSFSYHKDSTIPIIPTIPTLPKNKLLAKKYVEYLGGFPVIVKVLGWSHGIGIIKVESLESLISTADFIATQNLFAVVRKYIPHKIQGRLIVLGREVIASHANIATHDFRTNFGDNNKRKRKVMKFSPEIEHAAIKAVATMGIEFAGVDMLIHEDSGSAYISEVNFPCYFPTTQRLTGIDVAGKMVDYLAAKTQR